MNRIPVFLMMETGSCRIWLRRFRSTSGEDTNKCPRHGYHQAKNFVADAVEKKTPDGCIERISVDVYKDDPRWPVKCDCGYEFSVTGEADKWQVFTKSLYRRIGGSGGVMVQDEFPTGAMWNAWWLNDFPEHTGPDGKSLYVRLPGGHDWNIDGRAGNCDSPCKNCGQPYHLHVRGDSKKPNAANCTNYEDARPHKCWVRSGTPPALTVWKGAPGQSCNAGAGSILVPGWHGFLRNGALEQC